MHNWAKNQFPTSNIESCPSDYCRLLHQKFCFQKMEKQNNDKNKIIQMEIVNVVIYYNKILYLFLNINELNLILNTFTKYFLLQIFIIRCLFVFIIYHIIFCILGDVIIQTVSSQ